MKQPPIMIPLGYVVGTGEPVEVPLAHTFVTGQTQASGKTTTLQAIVARSGRRALAFVTKRGERLDGRAIRPYLPREGDAAIHWRFVETIMASALGQRALKYERLQIINAARGARSLDDVRRNLTRLLDKSKAGSPAAGIYELLGEYLDLVLPEMRALRATHELDLRPGLNVMDLAEASPEMQALAIGAAIEQVNEHEQGVLSVFPEAWQFAPRDRNTAARFAAEKTARMGAGIGNFLLCDSQDIVGVSPVIRGQSTVWIVGVQGEANELKRTLEVVKSRGIAAPKPAEVARLGVGQFFACHGRVAVKTYVRPAWMGEDEARDRARRDDTAPAAAPIVLASPPAEPEPKREPPPAIARIPELPPPATSPTAEPESAADAPQDESEDYVSQETNALLRQLLEKMNGPAAPPAPPAVPSPPTPGPLIALPTSGEDAIYERFKARLLADLPGIASGATFVVTPPEKLRKDFQREEADRILAVARGLKPLACRVFKLLLTKDEFVGQATIATRFGRANNGNAFTTLAAAINELAEAGFTEKKDKVGSRVALRAKVAADLAFYQATNEEVDSVYQNVVSTIAAQAAD